MSKKIGRNITSFQKNTCKQALKTQSARPRLLAKGLLPSWNLTAFSFSKEGVSKQLAPSEKNFFGD